MGFGLAVEAYDPILCSLYHTRDLTYKISKFLLAELVGHLCRHSSASFALRLCRLTSFAFTRSARIAVLSSLLFDSKLFCFELAHAGFPY